MIQLRPFTLDEFSTACQIKKIANDADQEKYRTRFANSGQSDRHPDHADYNEEVVHRRLSPSFWLH